MKHLKLTVLFIGLMLFANLNLVKAQEKANGKALIQRAIGEANKWANTRYLLYTATSPSTISGFQEDRTFLIDKKTGDCRFEGINKSNENVVLLFNYKSKTAKKRFINAHEDSVDMERLFENVLYQFFHEQIYGGTL